MQRRAFISLLGGAAVAWPALGHTQNPTKHMIVAMLISGSAAGVSRNVIGFRQRLQQLGYVEGRDLDIMDRYADGDVARLQALAEELVRHKPDIIVTTSPDGARAAMRVTAIIPIVSAALADPVSQGLITSQARPGANVTGILFSPGGLIGKQMELARELTPGATTFGALLDTSNPSNRAQRDDAEMAAATLRVKLVPIAVSSRDSLQTAIQKLAGERANWVLVSGSSLFLGERQRIAALAKAAGLPSIYAFREHVEAGGLISYGVNQLASHRRGADYVDMILKGAKPNEMPLEFPTVHISAINLKTARAIGITIPEAFLLQADEVIE